MITDAGKSAENGGSYIVYTIRTGVSTDCAGCGDMLDAAAWVLGFGRELLQVACVG